MGEALAIIIAFAALLGISWGVTCAAVWAICALMHWTFTLAAGTVGAHPDEAAAERKKEGCGSEAEHGNCRVLPDHAR